VDEERFDRMARTVAGDRSRRGLLRGPGRRGRRLGLVRLGGSDAAAGGQTVPLGGACIRSHQCVQYAVSSRGYDPRAQAVACDFNGFAYDGEFNCCRYRGGFCSVDNDCCGYLGCYGGRCDQ
jgi:hypothetical protein